MTCFKKIKLFFKKKQYKNFFIKVTDDNDSDKETEIKKETEREREIIVSNNPRAFNSMTFLPNILRSKIIDEKLLLNLTVISNIEKNDKLYLNNDVLTIDTNYFQMLTRWYSSQNRETTVDYIKHIITLSKGYNDDKTKELLQKCKTTSLPNLNYTYSNDENIVNKINSIIESI